MREQALGAILLVKAVEEADPGGALIASAERIAASREARRREGAADPPHAPGGLSEPAARLLAARAEKLLDGLVARHPFIPGFLSLARGPAAVGWLLVLAAAAAGVALSALDGTRQVNILGFPVIGLALWNIAVMLALLAAWTGAIGKRAAPRRPWAEALARMGSSLFAGLAGRFARVNAPLGEALRRFAIEWQAASRFLWIARAKRLLHLAAAALGIGLIGGLYLRGIGLDYEAGWESTFLNAPKVRAMQIISELEPFRRGIYAGAVGYFDLQGSMDFCIAIRTIVMSGEEAMIQAGAGIVADSDPAREWDEILNKAKILFRAVGVSPEALEAQ